MQCVIPHNTKHHATLTFKYFVLVSVAVTTYHNISIQSA